MSTCILDLPLELLQEILSHLDNPSLLQLGLTCKTFNRISLEFFFEKDTAYQLFPGWFLATRGSPEILWAMRAALWREPFHKLFYYFSSGINSLPAEVCELYHLIKCMSSIKGAHLNFAPCIGLKRWSQVVTRLLDMVIEKGCRELQIEGCFQRPESNEVPMEDFEKWAQIFQMHRTYVQQGSCEEAFQRNLNGSPLSDLSIRSDSMLHREFMPWTLKTLSTSRITKLSISCARVSKPTWSAFLRIVALPHLEDLEISSDPFFWDYKSSHPPFADLQHFFARHPGIRTLCWEGVERFQTPPTIEEPILPSLSSVKACSTNIVSLLQMHQSYPDTLTRLKSLTLSTGRQSHALIYNPFDAALDHLANFSGKDIALTLRFICSTGMSTWFARHVALGKENSSLSRLTCVSSLFISGGFVVGIETDVKANLPTWLSLFPCLKSVSFVQILYEGLELLKDEGFLEKIVESCPQIKVIRVGDLLKTYH